MPLQDRPDAIILPAVGTGIGGLPKSRFYDVLQKIILGELGRKDGIVPAELILQIWQGESEGAKKSTTYSIANALTQLANSWAELHPKENYAQLAVLLGISLAVAFAAFLRSLPVLAPLVGPKFLALDSSNAPLYAIGWAMASFGLATGIREITETLSVHFPFLETALALVIIGVLSAIFAGFVLKATDLYNTKSP